MNQTIIRNTKADWGRNAKRSRGIPRERSIQAQLSQYRKHAREEPVRIRYMGGSRKHGIHEAARALGMAGVTARYAYAGNISQARRYARTTMSDAFATALALELHPYVRNILIKARDNALAR